MTYVDPAAASAPQRSDADPVGPPPQQKVSYSASPGLASWLAKANAALAVTSYQSGKLYLLGANPRGGLMVHERFYRHAMGLSAPRPGTFLMASGFQVIRFENVLTPGQRANELHDACYVPRVFWTTGGIDAHDVGLLPDGRPVFVATGWNCLATVSEKHSFAEWWRPPFVSALVREDRCHLNGMAMGEGEEAGTPRFVTACSRSDTVDGWRDRRTGGGVVVDVISGGVVASGLSMPHSPRLHRGRLYVLNSGTGELGWIDRSRPAEEAFAPIAFCPGFARGLSFHEGFAVVGLSKPRYERFEGLPLDKALADRDSEAWCGVQVIELATGRVVHWFRIDGAIGELYDTAVLPGASCPMALGFASGDIASLVTVEPSAGG